MTATMSFPPDSLPSPPADNNPSLSCPNCGSHLPALAETQAALDSAQRRIQDLETQVRLLNQKAAAAIDRWADYEDELSRLRAAAAVSPTTTTVPPSPYSVASPARPSFLPAGAATRISALLSPRKSTPSLRTPSPPGLPPAQGPQHLSPASQHSPTPPSNAAPPNEELLEALSREQSLRKAAESRLSTTSREVEELSVALFEQANEMVATERRARARLAERVEVLERRDADKKRRLERLEQAMGRIERVRSILERPASMLSESDGAEQGRSLVDRRPASAGSGILARKPVPEQQPILA